MTTATKPTTAELHDLYIEQGLSQPAIGALYGVSRFTVRHWVKLAGIERPAPGKKTTDPKRNSWLDADGEAPPLRPNVVVQPGAHQQYVVDERRPARVHPLDMPATAEQLAEAAAILATTKAHRDPATHERARAAGLGLARIRRGYR